VSIRDEAEEAARAQVEAFTRAKIEDALRRHGGNRTIVARELKYVSPSSLRRAAERVGVDLAAFPPPTPQEIAAKPRAPRKPRAKPQGE